MNWATEIEKRSCYHCTTIITSSLIQTDQTLETDLQLVGGKGIQDYDILKVLMSRVGDKCVPIGAFTKCFQNEPMNCDVIDLHG